MSLTSESGFSFYTNLGTLPQNLQQHSREILTQLFNKVVLAIDTFIGPQAFRPFAAVNAATLDSIMVGVARRLDNGDISDGEAMKAAYKNLLEIPAYVAAIQSSTAEEASVHKRIELATAAFHTVQ